MSITSYITTNTKSLNQAGFLFNALFEKRRKIGGCKGDVKIVSGTSVMDYMDPSLRTGALKQGSIR